MHCLSLLYSIFYYTHDATNFKDSETLLEAYFRLFFKFHVKSYISVNFLCSCDTSNIFQNISKLECVIFILKRSTWEGRTCNISTLKFYHTFEDHPTAQQLNVVNHYAKRGIKLASDFAETVKKCSTFNNALQVVEKYRKHHPNRRRKRVKLQ